VRRPRTDLSALSPQEALSYIRAGSVKHFDPPVVTAFIALLEPSMEAAAVYSEYE
jgi:HD-GYP domain